MTNTESRLERASWAAFGLAGVFFAIAALTGFRSIFGLLIGTCICAMGLCEFLRGRRIWGVIFAILGVAVYWAAFKPLFPY